MGLCPVAWAEQALITVDRRWCPLPHHHWGRGAALGVWTIASRLQRRDVILAVDQG